MKKSIRFFNGIKVISHKKFLKEYHLFNFSRIIILDKRYLIKSDYH